MSAVEQSPGLNSSSASGSGDCSSGPGNNRDNNNNNNSNSMTSQNERKRKRRWGDVSSSTNNNDNNDSNNRNVLPSVFPTPVSNAQSGPLESKAKALALKASVAARLAALKAKTGGGSGTAAATAGSIATTTVSSVTSLKRPVSATSTIAPASHPIIKRAKHYELDMNVTGPTFRSETSTSAPPKPKLNPYLAHRQQQQQHQQQSHQDVKDEHQNQQQEQQEQPLSLLSDDIDTTNHDNNDSIDERLVYSTSSHRRQRRELHFVEPGTFVQIAQRKRQRAINAESAGFVSGRKVGQFVQSTSIMSSSHNTTTITTTNNNNNNINYYGTTEILDTVTDLGLLPPRPEADQDKQTNHSNLSSMPLVLEWWDMELLPTKLKKQVANFEGKVLSKETQSQMQQLSTESSTTKTTHHENDQVDGDNNNSNSNTETNAELPLGIRILISSEAEELRTKCAEQASLSYCKTAGLVQHIVPIKPPHANRDGPEAEPVLYLTKKERKRQRKRQREAKQRELQDLQAAGLIEAPEPRLTLQNFIRVLGDQAYLDPSQMEQRVMEQMQARQRAHLQRNEARKLSRAQKAEKLRRKYQEDTSETGVHVALFYVKNMSHPYHRTKVDLNAQQYNITGGVVECQSPQVACVIGEGGPKAIKKYIRLMLVRMKWKGPDHEDDDDDDDVGNYHDDDVGAHQDSTEEALAAADVVKHKFDKENKCELVWTGMATKRFFKGFVFQACESSDQARKILRSKGVGHYWDQVLTQASGRGESMNLKLADSDHDNDDDEHDDHDDDNQDMDITTQDRDGG
jgi:U4/U6 small nuclear ribonucleoprotein PRP3